ncbi:MAG: hypothetical protein QOH60_4903 [Mycobacterium sp.]|nr:hypothetical protein [Mycobacterium sp.]
MYRIFVSHSSRDTPAAVALIQWLTDNQPSLRGGIFLDVDPHTGLSPGTRWKEELFRAVDRCEAVLCLLTPNWEQSSECLVEYRYAESLNKRIFCARLDPEAVGDKTHEWQYCDLFSGSGPVTAVSVDGQAPVEFSTEGLERLLRGIRESGIGAEHFPWPPPDDPKRAPYRGWQPMEDIDAAVYFGRDAQIVRGLDALRGMRATGVEGMFVVLGPSGVGKSSFLRAGLLPRLRRDHSNFVLCDIVRPERAALTGEQGLARAILNLRARAGLNEPALGDIKSSCLAADAGAITQWMSEALQRLSDDGEPTLILPIDQAEELFTAESGQEAGRFLTLLGALLQRSGPAGELPMVAVVTIRADRYEALQAAPELADVHAREFGDLKPMPLTEFREVITGPAQRATAAGQPLTLEPALIEELLSVATKGGDSLPLLALTLSSLYADYGSTGQISLAHYLSMGGMAQIVDTEIDRLLSSDPDTRAQQLDILRSAFIPWLATVNPDSDQPLRRVARWAELPPASHDLINAMVAHRLLVKDERDGDTVVEVALESLLRQWDPLVDWLREQATDLKEADILDRATGEWERNGRSPEWLIEGVRLAAAEELAASPMFRARVAPASEFLRASRERQDAEAETERQRQEAELRAAQEHAAALLKRTRLLRAVLALVIVVALAAIVGFGWAFKARRDADARFRDATALRLYGDSQLMLAGLRAGVSDDVAGMQMLLAALEIPSGHQNNQYSLVTALRQQKDLLKVIDTSAMVFTTALSPDGTRIVSGGEDGMLRIWDAASGQPVVKAFHGHDKGIMSVAFNTDGTRIASCSIDGTVRIWDAATGHPIGQPFRDPNGFVGLAYSPDSTRLAAVSAGGVLRVLDAATGDQITQSHLDAQSYVGKIAFSPDGHRIATAGDKTIQVWDATTGQQAGPPIRGHEGLVFAVAFSPDGTELASASTDSTVRLWDAATGRQNGEPMRHDNQVQTVAFSPDGQRLASGGVDNKIKIWDRASHREIGVLNGHRAPINGVAFSKDGLRLVSCSDDDTVRVWDGTWQPMIGHTGIANAIFVDDGRRIASGGEDKIVRYWDAATARQIGEPVRIVDDDATSVFPVDRDRVVSFGTVNTVRLWDAHTGAPLGEPLRLGPQTALRQTHYDGGRIAAQTSGGVVQIWDATTMAQITTIKQDETAFDLSLSPDGKIVATSAVDGTLRLFSTDSGKMIGHPMEGQGVANSIAFSADGRLVAVGGSNKTIQVWAVDTTAPVTEPLQADGTVLTLAFSPDGHTVASSNADGNIRLWDVDSKSQLGSPFSHAASAWTLTFSPDSTKLLVGSGDGSVQMWPVLKPQREALCAKMTHNMSREQWNSWISSAIPYIDVCPGLPESDDSG